MYKVKSKKSIRKKVGLWFIIFGFVFICAFIYMDTQMRPILEKATEYQCKILINGLINNAILDELSNELSDYSSLITLKENSNGEIISIESNVMNINRLKSRSSLLISEAVKDVGEYDVQIPLGSITGITTFYGRGFSLPIHIVPRGFTNSTLISKFTSAGINQTLHQIVMEISVELSAIIPGYSHIVSVTTEFLIAETVIIGEVPESYMNIAFDRLELSPNLLDKD